MNDAMKKLELAMIYSSSALKTVESIEIEIESGRCKCWVLLFVFGMRRGGMYA
jgi:hypothetical protein